jgi:hypothetical protein
MHRNEQRRVLADTPSDGNRSEHFSLLRFATPSPRSIRRPVSGPPSLSLRRLSRNILAWDVFEDRRSNAGWGPYLALASKRHV